MSPDKIFIFVNARPMSLAGLMATKQEDIWVVDASGCTGLTTLPDLPNTKIRASGPSEQYFFAGVDSRGYMFEGMTVRGQWRVIAGCRDYSIPGARKHWGAGGESDRPDCLALVEKIAAAAKK